jgi:cytochrome c oxidase assembly protein subunit 15
MNHTDSNPVSPSWLHWLAVLTVCAAVVLFALGAVVTTYRVGMSDPIWPTYPWHLLLISWEEPRAGYLIEHTHRLAAYIVFGLVSVLAVGLWCTEKRSWLRWLGALALQGVIIQGLLGGFRVRLNELLGTDLAMIHGCFAQLVFALLASLALFTSRSWAMAGTATGDLSRVRRCSTLAASLIYFQLVLGAVVRHTSSPLGQRGHFLIAFAVVAAVAWLAKSVSDLETTNESLTRTVRFLTVLVVFQLLLGVEAWMMKFASEVLPELQRVTLGQGMIRTAHFVLGSGIFATSVIVALRLYRLGQAEGPEAAALAAALRARRQRKRGLEPTPLRQLEGSA